MGSFSFTFAPKTREEKVVDNIVCDGHTPQGSTGFICYLPKHLGGCVITEPQYSDYGKCGHYDLFALLWAFNTEGIWDVVSSYNIEVWNDLHRGDGIDMFFSGEMEFPLKLLPFTEENLKLTYEDIEGVSMSDPAQGFYHEPFEYPWGDQ